MEDEEGKRGRTKAETLKGMKGGVFCLAMKSAAVFGLPQASQRKRDEAE